MDPRIRQILKDRHQIYKTGKYPFKEEGSISDRYEDFINYATQSLPEYQRKVMKRYNEWFDQYNGDWITEGKKKIDTNWEPQKFKWTPDFKKNDDWQFRYGSFSNFNFNNTRSPFLNINIETE